MDWGLLHRCVGRYGGKRTLGTLHIIRRALAACPSPHPKAKGDIEGIESERDSSWSQKE